MDIINGNAALVRPNKPVFSAQKIRKTQEIQAQEIFKFLDQHDIAWNFLRKSVRTNEQNNNLCNMRILLCNENVEIKLLLGCVWFGIKGWDNHLTLILFSNMILRRRG